jgi:hypothetical protein
VRQKPECNQSRLSPYGASEEAAEQIVILGGATFPALR